MPSRISTSRRARKGDQAAVPGCPAERAEAIAQHAGAGRALDPAAMVASVRHIDTPYDTLLMSGVGRAHARVEVTDQFVETILDSWRVAILR